MSSESPFFTQEDYIRLSLCQCDNCLSKRLTIQHNIIKFIKSKGVFAESSETLVNTVSKMVIPYIHEHFFDFYSELHFEEIVKFRDRAIEYIRGGCTWSL